MDIYLYFLRIRQLSTTTLLQVDQTYPLGSILSHVLIQKNFKELNQLDISVMGAIGKSFEGVVPSYDGTQQWAILSPFLFYTSIFEVEGHLQRIHPALGLMDKV